MTDHDIVARLRRAEWYCNKSEEHMGYCDKKCARRNSPNPDECQEAADEIERLRAERDEARRRLCIEWTEHGPVRLNKEQIAMRYGWDCFKENTNG